MTIPFSRGFPTDWPIRPANFLQFDFQAVMRNLIHLWLPEGVANGDENLLSRVNEEVDYHFATPSKGVWKHTFEKAGVIRMQGTCGEIRDGISMTLDLTNLSQHGYASVRANVCVQLAAAPDFTDVAFERTFYAEDDQLKRFHAPAMDAQALTAGYGSGQAVENFIAVASRDAGFTIAQWCQGAASPGGNRHRSFACIHAPPVFRVIEPGQTVSRQGRLYLMPGRPEDAFHRFLSDR